MLTSASGVAVKDRDERPAPEPLSPEEVQQAIEFRKKALKSPDTDLRSIARTAPAVSVSPKQSTPIVPDADVCGSASLDR